MFPRHLKCGATPAWQS